MVAKSEELAARSNYILLHLGQNLYAGSPIYQQFWQCQFIPNMVSCLVFFCDCAMLEKSTSRYCSITRVDWATFVIVTASNNSANWLRLLAIVSNLALENANESLSCNHLGLSRGILSTH